MVSLIGRKPEKERLERLLKSPKSEFLAIFGRRRVGKTFLVREFFQQKFDFYTTGLARGKTTQQLAGFSIALQQYFGENTPMPKNWLEAFNQLGKSLEKSATGEKKVIFIDEMPWFDTPRSDFMTGLEFFWNSWASARKDILLIVCGSAASWMINNLIRNTGGLYNRVTERIKLEPFNLYETALFLQNRQIDLDRYQILQLYMVTGGIPFYLEQVQGGQSAMQQIERICFHNNGLLRSEFSYVFSSLFKKADKHEKILKTIFERGGALTRDELIRHTGLSTGGTFSRVLNELEESGFISTLPLWEGKKYNLSYFISDFYTLFYFKFIERSGKYTDNMWMNKLDSPDYRAWSGLAFERICLLHITQIKKALGISGITSEAFAWQHRSGDATKGAQIDLVVDRRDRVINLFEIKFTVHPIVISKEMDADLRHKISVFKTVTGTSKSVFLTLLSTFGVTENAYSGNLHTQLSMEVLFEP
jgi:uncharacterized protein